MSEMPLHEKSPAHSLWPIAAGILLLVFTPAALAFILALLRA